MKSSKNFSPDQHNYHASSMFAFQEQCLKLFGFLQPQNPPRTKTAKFYSLFIPAFLLSGGIICATIYSLSVIWTVVVTESKISLLRMLSYIPYAFTNIRAIYVVVICWKTSSSWYCYQRDASAILWRYSRPEELSSEIRNWTIISVALGTGSFLAVAIVDVIDWFHYFDEDPRRYNMYYDAALDPLPMRFLIWEYIVVWELFCSFLFFLSQQLFIAIIQYAFILGSALRDLRSSLQMDFMPEFTQENTSNICGGRREAEESYGSSYKRLRNSKNRYFEILKLSKNLNATYGSALLVIYGMDLMTICGFVAGLVANEEKFLTAYLGNIVGVVVFGSYICCMVPMAWVYEEVGKINLALHKIVEHLQPVTDAFIYQKDGLNSYAADFIALIRDQPIIFSGAEIIHVTRGFLAGTVTFILSSALILREMVQRTEDSHLSCTTAYNIALLEAALHSVNSSLLQNICSNATANGKTFT